ncbi:MAG: glutaredoxin family protein [Actinomycetia bacterium]|nr:glutaredoxin family protein [Actinomycetes bacterium]
MTSAGSHFPPADDFEVRVYSTVMCQPCEALKADLRRAGIPFKVFDPMLDEEAADFLDDRHIRTTPVLTVGEDIYINYHAGLVADLFG